MGAGCDRWDAMICTEQQRQAMNIAQLDNPKVRQSEGVFRFPYSY